MNKDNSWYGYINLKNLECKVSILFSQDFYIDKKGMDEDLFRKFMKILSMRSVEIQSKKILW